MLGDDPILNSYAEEFQSNYNLKHLRRPDLFEYFSTYCGFFRDFTDQIELDDVLISGGEDTGIDSIGIFLNESLTTSADQARFLLDKGRAEAQFAFLQAKTSKSISATDVGNFFEGVVSFFSDSGMRKNADVMEKISVKDFILKNAVKLRGRPKLILYYAYCGNYQEDQNIEARIRTGRARLQQLNIADEIKFIVLDKNHLQNRYQETLLRVEKEIVLSEYATLPEIRGIRQSYLGILPCSELVKLLSNSDGNLQKSLFNENVRDFLRNNRVNNDIASTIRDPNTQDRLPALNNGVTIVCKSIRIINKRFILSDFQIVNGCQTSHIVFYNKERIHSNVSVAVKIIEAEDRDLVNEIVKATNRQTEVVAEAFVGLGEYHKKLERFFESIDLPVERKIVYERRKGQYADFPYSQNNIVNLALIVNSFAACFKTDLISFSRYYGETIRIYENELFLDEHSPWIYFISSFLFKRIEASTRGNQNKGLWRLRSVLAYLIVNSFGAPPSLLSQNRIETYCKRIVESCREDRALNEMIQEAENHIVSALKSYPGAVDTRNPHQDRRFIEYVIRHRAP